MLQDIFPHQFLITYDSNRTPQPDDSLILMQNDQFLLHNVDRRLRFPLCCEQNFSNCRYLFSIDDRAYFWKDSDSFVFESDYKAVTSSFFRQRSGDKVLDFVGLTASQLIRWYHENRFCSSCGHPTEHDAKERMLFCPNCGRQVYPKISPALILAVYDGDRLLMSRYRGHNSDLPLGADSALLAGFMEVGETPEDAARREVMEETGIRIKNLRYYRSQPWSISDSLLLGFTAELDGDDTITLQEDELSVAGWVHRKDIIRENDDFSLTNEMICAFRDGLLP